MKRNLNFAMLAIDGKTPLKQKSDARDDETGEIKSVEGEIIASNVVILSLLTPHSGEESIDAKEKIRRANLAERIYKSTPEANESGTGTDVEFDMDEAALILAMVAKQFAPLIVMQISRTLEG